MGCIKASFYFIGLSGFTLFAPEGTGFMIVYRQMSSLEFYAVAGLICTIVCTLQQKRERAVTMLPG
jgi:hypothetical protein